METRGLSVTELCRILEAASKTGVRSLQFRDLRVKFGPSPAELGNLPGPSSPSPAPVDLTAAQHKKLAEDYLEKEEVETREDQLAELLVTDPLAYEEMIRNGDLTDEPAGHDRDSFDADDDDGESI